MSSPRQPLYLRLPEIYRIRDGEQQPPGQLQAYLGLMDGAHAAVRDNIEALYHDLFAETCADWVIPYLADLLGVSHLSGDPWTLRADVARSIHHRRRKGTLGAIESLTHALSGWAAHAVEMRDRLVWNQHLNHQRPDAGGRPPLPLSPHRGDARRGGTVNLRDPALLSLLNGPFDPFAHLADVKPEALHNLPNLAVFLWRLQAFTVTPTRPGTTQVVVMPVVPGNARFAVRVTLHPQSEPMVLFNTHRFHADDEPPELSLPDAVPGPMPRARLSSDTAAGRAGEYVEVIRYPAAATPVRAERLGLALHVPEGPFTAATPWRFRGANLCAWETGLQPALRPYEIAIDPDRGRVVIGTMGAVAATEADPLATGLYVSTTHASAGPLGAQLIAREAAPANWQEQPATLVIVDTLNTPGFTLQQALANLHQLTQPLIIEIRDSLVHALDIAAVTGSDSEGGLGMLRLGRSLWIRAGDRQRPVIRLTRPLAFRPHDVLSPGAEALMDRLMVRLEGLYLTRNAAFPLIARAALNQLHVQGCTLDPGGVIGLDGVRSPLRVALHLEDDYGFVAGPEQTAFDQTPEIIIERCFSGKMELDAGYRLDLRDSVVDAGGTVENTSPTLAICAASAANPETAWGPALTFSGLTVFGRVRVTSAAGRGAIFVHALQVLDTQSGCIKFSRFKDIASNRLPSHHGCWFGDGSDLHFSAETFGRPDYARLERDSDPHVLEQGPGNDEMGAFGFLKNSHRLKNLQIRYREYMPVGIRPVLVTLT
jgi:hypothetical protein